MHTRTPRATASTVGHAPPSIDFTLTDGQGWMRDGACKSLTGKEIDTFFFPINEDLEALTQPAKRICAECPVRLACREYAMTMRLPVGEDEFAPNTPQKYRHGAWLRGIWGGTTTKQRTQLRRHWEI